MPAPQTNPPTTPAAKLAATMYTTGLEQARKDYAQRVAKIVADTLARLQQCMTLATQAGDLDEAIKIRDAIQALEALQPQPKPKPDTAPPAPPARHDNRGGRPG